MKLTCLFLFIIFSTATYAQNNQTLKHFDKIVISPMIEAELVRGEMPGISWEVFNVSPEKFRIEVKRGKLHLYLEEAKVINKPRKGSKGSNNYEYDHDVLVKVKVTFTELDQLEIRGEEKLNISSQIVANKFTIKAYGENEIYLEQLDLNNFKAILIGENKLLVGSGVTNKNKFKSIGENEFHCERLLGESTKASSVGASHFYISSSSFLRVNALGESEIYVVGDPVISRGLMIGANNVIRK